MSDKVLLWGNSRHAHTMQLHTLSFKSGLSGVPLFFSPAGSLLFVKYLSIVGFPLQGVWVST